MANLFKLQTYLDEHPYIWILPFYYCLEFSFLIGNNGSNNMCIWKPLIHRSNCLPEKSYLFLFPLVAFKRDCFIILSLTMGFTRFLKLWNVLFCSFVCFCFCCVRAASWETDRHSCIGQTINAGATHYISSSPDTYIFGSQRDDKNDSYYSPTIHEPEPKQGECEGPGSP